MRVQLVKPKPNFNVLSSCGFEPHRFELPPVWSRDVLDIGKRWVSWKHAHYRALFLAFELRMALHDTL